MEGEIVSILNEIRLVNGLDRMNRYVPVISSECLPSVRSSTGRYEQPVFEITV